MATSAAFITFFNSVDLEANVTPLFNALLPFGVPPTKSQLGNFPFVARMVSIARRLFV
jgi:hypothetical protein